MVQRIGTQYVFYPLNFISIFYRKNTAFYIQLLYKKVYLLNNVMCGWKLFLVLLTYDLSSICLR